MRAIKGVSLCNSNELHYLLYMYNLKVFSLPGQFHSQTEESHSYLIVNSPLLWPPSSSCLPQRPRCETDFANDERKGEFCHRGP